MQPQNVNALTENFKFKRLDVKLQNPQNSGKFLIFFVKSQRREHCDSEVIHVILNQAAESIDSDDFLAGVMRRLFVCVTCVINQEHFSKTGRIFQRIEALIRILPLSSPWDARDCSRANPQPVHAPGGPWAGHEHIGPKLPGPPGARLKDIPEFTMLQWQFHIQSLLRHSSFNSQSDNESVTMIMSNIIVYII